MARRPIHFRQLALLGLIVVFGPCGCSQLPPDARNRLIRSDGMYRSGQFEQVRRELTPLIQQHADKPEIAEAYYLRGLCELRLQNRSAGRADMEKAVSKAQRPDLRASAHATLGSMAYEDDDCAGAVQHLQAAVDELPERPPLDELLLQLGTSLQRTGQWGPARLVFARLMHKMGRSPAAGQAQRKYSWPREQFSIQAGAFRSAENAREQAARLRQAGFDATCRLDAQVGGGLHVVYLGQYSTWAAARTDLARVQAVEPNAVIVP